MEYNFHNKVVLVTGGSAGIGEAIALLFATCGAKLVIVGRDKVSLQDVAQRCKAEKGQDVLPIVADIGTDDGCKKIADETFKYFGRLDVLVNNAAIGVKATIQTTNMETFDRVFAVNVRGVYNLTRLLVPALLESKGNIVNISSVAGIVTNVGNLPYGMSKWSKFYQRATGVSSEKYNEIMARTSSKIVPMGSVCDGIDIARMVVHIASDHSRLVTGSLVVVDGGLQYNYHTNLLQES